MPDFLKEQLRPASFRGVAFAVDAASATAGRRTALHEYPKQDIPYVEDLGRATREYQLTAIIVGTDYIERTQSLMAALEESGAGKLVHPWLGEISAVPTQVGTVNFDSSLGRATVSLTFIEAGELRYPGATTAYVSRLHSAIDDCTSASCTALSVSLAGLPDATTYVQTAIADQWAKLQENLCKAFVFVDSGKDAAISLISLRDTLAEPLKFAESVVDALDFSSLFGTKADWCGNAERLADLAADPMFSPADTAGMVADSSDRVIADCSNALKSFVRENLMCQAAGCASFAGESGDSKNLADSAVTTSYDALISCRDKVCNGVDAAALDAADDELAVELEGLRAAVYEALTDRAQQSARIMHIDFPAGLPLVVCAYQRHGDAERADEIARLNGLHHLGFSPAGGLKVLSE